MTCIPDMFPPTFVVWGNTQRATDLPEAFFLHTEGDVYFTVIIVDFIEKRFDSGKHPSVDAASRIPDLPSEKAVRLFVECPTTIDESCA